MLSPELSEKIMQDITLLKYVGMNPLRCTAAAGISTSCSSYEIDPLFHNGLRVTDTATMEVVQMVLLGKINKDIVSQLGVAGAKPWAC